MKKCHFIKTLLAVCLLSAPGVNSLAEKRQESNALRVVNGVTVGVSCTEDAEKAGLEAKIIQGDSALQLQRAGIKVVDKQSGYMPPTIPDLQIRIKAYEISEKQIIVDNIDIFLNNKQLWLVIPTKRLPLPLGGVPGSRIAGPSSLLSISGNT